MGLGSPPTGPPAWVKLDQGPSGPGNQLQLQTNTQITNTQMNTTQMNTAHNPGATQPQRGQGQAFSAVISPQKKGQVDCSMSMGATTSRKRDAKKMESPSPGILSNPTSYFSSSNSKGSRLVATWNAAVWQLPKHVQQKLSYLKDGLSKVDLDAALP